MLIQPSRTKAAPKICPGPKFQNEPSCLSKRSGPKLSELYVFLHSKDLIHLHVPDTQPGTKSAADWELRKFSVRKCVWSPITPLSQMHQSSGVLTGLLLCVTTLVSSHLSSFSADARHRVPTYTQYHFPVFPRGQKRHSETLPVGAALSPSLLHGRASPFPELLF